MNKEILEFEKAFENGIYLNFPSRNKNKYNWKKLMKEQERLGRQLTKKELSKFISK